MVPSCNGALNLKWVDNIFFIFLWYNFLYFHKEVSCTINKSHCWGVDGDNEVIVVIEADDLGWTTTVKLSIDLNK